MHTLILTIEQDQGLTVVLWQLRKGLPNDRTLIVSHDLIIRFKIWRRQSISRTNRIRVTGGLAALGPVGISS